MMQKDRALLAGMIMALSASPIVILGLVAWHDPSDRYWASVYVVWGTVFAALSSVAAGWVTRRARAAHSRLTGRVFCFAGFAAWALSFPTLVVINLTPLCLGQDNGDGRNGVITCLLLAVVWFVFMTLPAAGGIAVVSRLASKVANGDAEEHICRTDVDDAS